MKIASKITAKISSIKRHLHEAIAAQHKDLQGHLISTTHLIPLAGEEIYNVNNRHMHKVGIKSQHICKYTGEEFCSMSENLV